MRKFLYISLLLLSLAIPAQSWPQIPAARTEVEPLNTDRPHITENPYVLPEGQVQTENGVLFLRERGSGEDRLSFPFLTRIGTGSNFEVRIETETYALESNARGLTDPSLGFKYRFFDEGPEMSILFKLNIPAGARAFRSDAAEPELRWLFSSELKEGLDFELNLGVAGRYDKPSRQYIGQLQYVASLTQELSPSLNAYIEFAGQGPEQRGGPYTHFVDGGLLYLINADLQLDLEYYRGLSSSGIDWGVGFGISRRW